MILVLSKCGETRINETFNPRALLDKKGGHLHQGDTLDYHNLIPLAEHAKRLSAKLGKPIRYIDDVAGPAAQAAIKALPPGEAVLLGNVRYLTEEVSTFEKAVKLTPKQMVDCYLVRQLAPLADYYVNAPLRLRNSPSRWGCMSSTNGGGRRCGSTGIACNHGKPRPSVFVSGTSLRSLA